MASRLKEQTALVVGGAGFVGSNVVRLCLDEGATKVTVVDNLLSAERKNIPDDSRVAFIQGSIADDEVLGQLKDEYDVVFHLNTFHGNESSIARPLDDHANNLLTTLKLYEHLKDFERLKRVVYSSTGCALAAKGTGPVEAVVEDGPVPLDYDSPYQISKVVGEMYGLYYHQQHDLPFVRARFQNVYGPGEVLGAGEWRGHPATVFRNVTPTFIYRALKGQPLIVFGEGDSSRDFIHVTDIAEGLLRLAITPGIEGDVFNLASGGEVTIKELAEKVNALTNNPGGIEFKPQRSWDRSIRRYGSPDKSQKMLGFEAVKDFDEGLAELVDWMRDNLDWIDACIAKHKDHFDPGF